MSGGLVRAGVVAGLVLGAVTYAIAADITMTTYYPTPYGSYRELRTLNNTFLATNAAANVGIGLTNPTSKLHVQGNVNILGRIRIQGGAPSAGRVLTSDAVGLASWQTPPPGCFYAAP
jgi:hypothetical protein